MAIPTVQISEPPYFHSPVLPSRCDELLSQLLSLSPPDHRVVQLMDDMSDEVCTKVGGVVCISERAWLCTKGGGGLVQLVDDMSDEVCFTGADACVLRVGEGLVQLVDDVSDEVCM